MQTRWRVIQPPRGFTDTFVRNAWSYDLYDVYTGRYTEGCDRFGMTNTLVNMTSGTSGVAAYSDVGYTHAGITSSPNYLFTTRTKGSSSAWDAMRIRLSDFNLETVSYTAGETASTKTHVSALCPYTDDVGFMVVQYYDSGDQWYNLNKINFVSGTSTEMIAFPIDGSGYGFQSTDLSIHWVAGVSGWRIVYPYLRWHLDGFGDPDYATDIDWYIFDPATETEDVVTQSLSSTSFLMPDGYNLFSNSVLIDNKLVTFISNWDADTLIEVHCLDLVALTDTVNVISEPTRTEFVCYGSAPDASQKAVYCRCVYYNADLDYVSEVYKYIPSTNTLSSNRIDDVWSNSGQHGILADSQHAYVLISFDGVDQELIQLSNGNTILTTSVTTSACATIDDDRHGLITANSGSSTVTVYYDDSSTDTMAIDSATGSTKHLYLHRERFMVIDENGTTDSFFVVATG